MTTTYRRKHTLDTELIDGLTKLAALLQQHAPGATNHQKNILRAYRIGGRRRVTQYVNKVKQQSR